MKKGRLVAETKKYLLTYITFFVVFAFQVSISFFLFFHFIHIPTDQIRPAAILTLLNILFINLIFVIVDVIRRKIMVERPVREIKAALNKITQGDFSVRLAPQRNSYIFSDIIKSINVMTEELSGVETLRSDFIADVSHEMKTPLAVISNYGSLLQEEKLPEDRRLEYAAAVTDSAKALAELVTNILKLNRLENQQVYPKKEKFNLSEQLCESLLMFETVWEEKEIQIEANIAPDVSARSDPELLSIVWSNLLSNAFKFTPRGGRVTLTLSENGEDAVVSVADTGCGMTEETGKHIFEKFYQGDSSRETRGNGLGLALVKRIIDITRGEISVSSTLGEGSIFTVAIKKDP